MTVFDFLNLIGGVSLFLFGMNLMGSALERKAGKKLRSILSGITDNKFAGILVGICITAIIQSSSGATVMVVGFVNSGIMTLRQSINIIMGANIGTTITAWILSLTGIEGGGLLLQLFKPSSFSPVLALVGILLYLSKKTERRKDTGLAFLGFAILMFGMETMTHSVSSLGENESFRNLFVLFSNPLLGVLAGALLTAVIQSSSASVGMLQALAVGGGISYGVSIPIVMGQNIGTCATALISSVGANKNAKRAALVHLLFNMVGTIVILSVFLLVRLLFPIGFFNQNATAFGIALVHSIFNMLCLILLLPFSSLLEKAVCHLVKDDKSEEMVTELDDRLLATPAVALERCSVLMKDMAHVSIESVTMALSMLMDYSEDTAAAIKDAEEKTDHYEDVLSTYLVRLSASKISDADTRTAGQYLKLVSDFERMADHSVNISETSLEIKENSVSLSTQACEEISMMSQALNEILNLACKSFVNDDLSSAILVEPLEQVIDDMKDKIRTNHIERMQKSLCSIEAGFVLADIITDIERVSDHCSNIAGSVIDSKRNTFNIHETLRDAKKDKAFFEEQYRKYGSKYGLFCNISQKCL